MGLEVTTQPAFDGAALDRWQPPGAARAWGVWARVSSRAGVLALSAVLLLLLGGRGFWDPDEPRFAEVAREMLLSGDWVVPHFNGEPLALLPPLTYWATAAFSWPAGDVSEWSARVPVALFAVLAIAATMLVSERAGWLAGLVLLASAKFLHQAQYLQADMFLVGSQCFALAACYRAHGAEGSRRTRWLVAGYVSIALAMLAKGPLGALLPAGVFGVFLIWERDLRALRRMGLAWGIPLVVALVLPWYAAACARCGEAFCHELVVKQNFAMFFDTWSHARPVYYYLVQLPWMFLPWTLLAPAALLALPAGRETRFLVSWIAFTFLLFSASDAKQAKYLLGILPPLAIAVASFLREAGGRRSLRVSAFVLAALATAGGIAVLVGLPDHVPDAVPGALAVCAALAMAFALAGALAARREVAVSLLAGGVLLGALVGRYALVPALEPQKLPLALTETAARLGAPVAIHGIGFRQIGGLVFYGGRPLPLLVTPESFEEFMSAPELRLAYVPRKLGAGSYAVLADSRYREGTLLVSNQPGGKP